uniref:THAP-type domain-containing protein n=1 Tax=Anopheles farauti TaxID=69004 RepID=A0A182QST1_9DIPT
MDRIIETLLRETNRFRRWLTLINNPRLLRMEPMSVFKSARICRRHFAADCFNGDCRKLLPTAIPSLYLPEVRPVALVQPMDAVGDELERLLRDERRQQLKRHGETPFVVNDLLVDGGGKRPKIGITLLSEDPECSIGENVTYGDTIFTFGSEEDYENESHASDSIISSGCGTDYSSLTSFSGLISHPRELDTLNQVEILNEPPETLLNDSPPPEDPTVEPIEIGYEQLVREFANEASNDEEQTEQLIQIKQPNVAVYDINWQQEDYSSEASSGHEPFSKVVEKD